MARYAYAESGGQPIYYDGATHLLCIGISGSGKTATMNSLLWALLTGEEEVSAVVMNPKIYGLDWVTASPRVRYVNDPACMETVYQGLVDEMMRRYSLLESGEVSEDELQPLYVFQDELAALLGGSLILPGAAKPIKENLQKLLILARQAKMFVLAFSQTALAEYVAGTLTRANFGSTIIMHVTNSSELAMAANLAADDVSGTMNPTNFVRGELLAATEAGKSFVRGMAYYRPPEQLRAASDVLGRAEPADFSFLDKRGIR